MIKLFICVFTVEMEGFRGYGLEKEEEGVDRGVEKADL